MHVDQNDLTAMLPAKRLVCVALEVNLGNQLHAGNKACKGGDPSCL